MEAAKTELQDRLAELEDAKAAAAEEVATLQARLDDAMNVIADWERAVSDRDEQLQVQRNELSARAARVAQLEESSMAQATALADLQADRDGLAAQLAAAQVEHAAALAALRDELTAAHGQVEAAKADVEAATRERDHLEAQQRDALATHAEALAALQHRLDVAVAQCEAVAAGRDRMVQDAHADTNQLREQWEARLAERAALAATARDEAGALRRELDALQQELADARADLAAATVRSSTLVFR